MPATKTTHRGRLAPARVREGAKRVLGPLLPLARSTTRRGVRIGRRLAYPALRNWARIAPESTQGPAVYGFIVGCGRSGTTLLGAMLAQHQDVRYFYEPRTRWGAVNALTDLNGYLGGSTKPVLVLTATDATDQQRKAFRAVFRARGHRVVIEKTPINTFRMTYIDALEPRSKFVHIVRDGVDVSRSIERVAESDSPIKNDDLSPWWGTNESKWKAIQTEAKSRQYPAVWLAGNRDHARRATLEWALSVDEVETQQEYLGDRLLTVRYPDLIDSPSDVLREVLDFIGLPPDRSVLESAAKSVRRGTRNQEPIALPQLAAERFNRIQERYGFNGRASALSE